MLSGGREQSAMVFKRPRGRLAPGGGSMTKEEIHFAFNAALLGAFVAYVGLGWIGSVLVSAIGARAGQVDRTGHGGWPDLSPSPPEGAPPPGPWDRLLRRMAYAVVAHPADRRVSFLVLCWRASLVLRAVIVLGWIGVIFSPLRDLGSR